MTRRSVTFLSAKSRLIAVQLFLFHLFFTLQDDQTYDVCLRGRPFEGLGFDIVGNMTDGLFVSHVFNRGPAYEAGCIRPGNVSS